MIITTEIPPKRYVKPTLTTGSWALWVSEKVSLTPPSGCVLASHSPNESCCCSIMSETDVDTSWDKQECSVGYTAIKFIGDMAHICFDTWRFSIGRTVGTSTKELHGSKIRIPTSELYVYIGEGSLQTKISLRFQTNQTNNKHFQTTKTNKDTIIL